MNRISKIITFLLLSGVVLVLACKTSRQQEEDMSVRCCKECLEAFSQSPVGVGAAGAQCGAFSSGKPISQSCTEYFKKHPQSVADCE